MADHLGLPKPIPHQDRRQGSGFGRTERREQATHGRNLEEGLEAAQESAPERSVDGVDPRRVFKIRSSTRIGDNELTTRSLELLGDTTEWTYFVIPTDEDGTELYRAIKAYTESTSDTPPLASLFDRIERIEPYGPEDRLTASLASAISRNQWPLTVDVVVWPSATDDEARRRVSDVHAACEQYGSEIQGTDFRARTAAVRVRSNRETIEALLGLTVVESVRLPLAPLLEPSSWLGASVEPTDVPEPFDVVVGVIDDAVIAGHPLLQDVVISQESVPSTHAWKDAGPHGTMVAGIAAYGGFERAFSGGHVQLERPVRLACVRVLEPDESGDPNSTHLPSDQPDHEVIEEAIRRLHELHGVRVFNISITDRFPFSGPHASLLTETIDRLARELNIVVVVAAGNRRFAQDGTTSSGFHALHDYPNYLTDEEARLAEPAPVAIGVTVGSLGLSDAASTAHGASHVDHHVVAGRNRPSPFSRSGPGISGHVKPEFVHYGGDLVWSGIQLNSNNVGVGTVSLNSDFTTRLFRASSGTSYAAPRVAHLAARILHRYPDASANLIRVLLAMAADRPEESILDLIDEDLIRVVGLGMPNTELAIESGSNRVVMVAEGAIDVDSVLVHPIPVPEEFARGRADRSISIALGYDPPVRRQRREYLAGRIKVDLFRNIDVGEIVEVMGRQDLDDPAPMTRDRRRIQGRLRPTATLVLGSTLQARRWMTPSATSLDPDDGDTYYAVLTQTREAWADRLPESYDNQHYALAVELWDRDRAEIDLYNLVQNQVRVPAVLRVRL